VSAPGSGKPSGDLNGAGGDSDAGNHARPRLVFAHANGFPAGSYRRFLTDLEARFRVEAPDRLGHDPSYGIGPGWRGLVDELLDHIARNGPEPPWVVGHSMGGVLAFMAALKQPSRLRGFVMLDPPIVFGWRGPLLGIARRLGLIDRLTPAGDSRGRRRQWPDRDSALAHLGSRPLFREFDREALADYVDAAVVEASGGVTLRYDPEVEVEVFRRIPNHLHREPAPVQVPGAVLVARESAITHPGDLRRLQRRHQLLVASTTGGHLFPLISPQGAAAAVRQTIERLQQG